MSNKTLSTLVIVSLVLSLYSVINIHMPRLHLANSVMDHMDSDSERVAKMTMTGMQKMQNRIEDNAKTIMKKTLKDVAKKVEDDSSAPFVGSPDGDVKMIYFFDYRCGYCRKNYPTIKKLLESDKNLKIIYKEYPIFGNTSLSQIALAAHKQGKYEEIHAAFMENDDQLSEAKALDIAKKLCLDMKKLKTDMNSDEIKNTITDNIKLAQSMQINGTPTSIIGESVIIPGALSYDEFKEAVDSVRSGEGEENESTESKDD
jgi:protein-disulfide isomerase